MQGLKFRGRPPILIAGSVKGVVSLKNEYAQILMDRRQPIDEEFIGAIVAQSVLSWEGRNPLPALDPDGNFQGTDLDLLSFLTPIAARGAVIEIPRYRNRRKVVVRANERRVGNTRFGPITGLTSSQEVFSFSVRLFDQTIIKKDLETELEDVGSHRNYMVVDCDGHWYHGWDKIIWDPSREENRFLTEQGLWMGNTVYFRNYVHPNRWQSVFGAPHLLKKIALARIDDEAGFYRKEVKRLQEMAIVFPPGEIKEYARTLYEGDTVPVLVQTMEMVLDIPEFSGAYLPVPDTQAGLVAAHRHQKYLTYTLKPLVQFGVRANEAAYFLHGVETANQGKIASWMEGRTWQPGWKAPKGRVDWNQMVLGPDMALRWRVKQVTQHISAV